MVGPVGDDGSHAPLARGIETYQICARALLERIKDVAAAERPSSIALSIEESQRTDPLAVQFFSGYRFVVQHQGGLEELPRKNFFVSKAACEPGLEVADFIVQAAGAQARAGFPATEARGRKDFEAIFRADPLLGAFIEISQVTDTPAPRSY